MAELIKFAVKGVAGGIGLASESASAYKSRRKAKKDAERDGEASPPRYGGPNERASSEDDEAEQWELDEAQDEVVGGSNPQRRPIQDTEVLLYEFIRQYPQPAYSERSTTSRLPYPVVLPQRRPKDRSRGFVRAYAPILENRGIDQTMFLDFLETFNEASQASQWLNAINLATIGTMFLPHGISAAVSIAIQVTTKIAIEMQSRSRTNSFLDKVNDEFFRPRGLYCLLMTWSPESDEIHTAVNITTTVSESLKPSGSGYAQRIKRNLRSSSGKSYGNLDFPEVAPLIYPGLDYLASQESEPAVEQKKKLKKGKAFVEDYMDRRAQAKFVRSNDFCSVVSYVSANKTYRRERIQATHWPKDQSRRLLHDTPTPTILPIVAPLSLFSLEVTSTRLLLAVEAEEDSGAADKAEVLAAVVVGCPAAGLEEVAAED